MRQLPVGATISHMISSTLNNLRFALAAQWPWIAVLAVAYYVVGQAIGWDVILAEDPTAMETHFAQNPGHALYFLAGGLLYLVAFASIAVSWHRYVLKDEVPLALTQKLRLDSLVWRYVGNLILFVLMLTVAVLPPAILMGILRASGGGAALFWILALAMVVMLFYVATRWGLKFPAIALDRKDFGFGDAWRATQNNALPFLGLVVGFLAVNFAISIAGSLIAWVLQSIGGATLGGILAVVVQSVVQWVTTIMGITLYTSLYGFFVEERDFKA